MYLKIIVKWHKTVGTLKREGKRRYQARLSRATTQQLGWKDIGKEKKA
jgi:hypothetical protein